MEVTRIMAEIKDQHPQWLRGRVEQSVINTFAQQPIKTPVVPDLGNGKSLVMNVLRIVIETSLSRMSDTVFAEIQAQLSTRFRTAIGELSDVGIIINSYSGTRMLDTGATDGTVVAEYGTTKRTMILDVSDGKGNGILIGSPEIYLCMDSTNESGVKNARVAILYNLKTVNAQELMGIIAGA